MKVSKACSTTYREDGRWTKSVLNWRPYIGKRDNKEDLHSRRWFDDITEQLGKACGGEQLRTDNGVVENFNRNLRRILASKGLEKKNIYLILTSTLYLFIYLIIVFKTTK